MRAPAKSLAKTETVNPGGTFKSSIAGSGAAAAGALAGAVWAEAKLQQINKKDRSERHFVKRPSALSGEKILFCKARLLMILSVWVELRDPVRERTIL
jgi:hypothetical protein